MILFIFVSLGWGYYFLSDTLEMWHAVILLIIHGFAGGSPGKNYRFI